jgi:hypothetical protein
MINRLLTWLRAPWQKERPAAPPTPQDEPINEPHAKFDAPEGSFASVLAAFDALPGYMRDGFTKIAKMDEDTLSWIRQSLALEVQASEDGGREVDALDQALRGTAVHRDAVAENPLRWPSEEDVD